MARDKKDHDAITDIAKGLRGILGRMEGAVDGFTRDAVREIGKICETLLGEIKAAK